MAPNTCADFGVPPGVDVLDMQATIGYWNQPRDLFNWRCDLNWDGDVDIVDLMQVVAAWGSTCGSGYRLAG